MNRGRTIRGGIAASAFALLAVVAAMVTGPARAAVAGASSQCDPTIQELADLGYGGEVIAFNHADVAVGGVQDETGRFHPAWWDPSGGLHLVAGLRRGELLDVNNQGTMLGTTRDAAGMHSYVVVDGAVHFLQELGGTTTRARSINDQGQMAGTASNAGDADVYAVRWDSPAAAPQILQPASGDAGGFASAIDQRGEVGGESDGPPPDFATRPAIWTGDGTPTLLSTTSAFPNGSVHGFRGRGAVGELDAADFSSFHAAVWDADGSVTDLGTIPGLDSSIAIAAASNGWVIGIAGSGTDPSAPQEAIFWPGHGPLLELPTLLGRGVGAAAAHAISSDGTAAGWSLDAKGLLRPTVWTCVQNQAFQP